MAAIFLQSLIIGYSGAMVPGSMFTYTVDKGIRRGWMAGLLVSLGHALLELVLITLVLAGAGKYLTSAVASAVIGLIGGLVLGYMGVQMIRGVYQGKISLDVTSDGSNRQENMFLAGIVLSATNPYVTIWWATAGLTLMMNSFSSYGIAGITVFFIAHMICDISWFTFVAAVVSKARHKINKRAYKVIIVLLALCLIGFGASFFASGIKFILNL